MQAAAHPPEIAIPGIQSLSTPLGIDHNANRWGDDFVSQLKKLEEEPLEMAIGRLVHRDGYSPTKAAALRVEFLRFAALNHVTTFALSPSPEVDDFWHAFILYTKEYQAFCERHFGCFFHHRPSDHNARGHNPEPGLKTKALIQELFPDHDRQIWAKMSICSNEHCDTAACDGPGYRTLHT